MSDQPSVPAAKVPPDPARKEQRRQRWTRLLNGLLAAMIATYGIMTAGTAYIANRAEGRSQENYVAASAYLDDANFYYTEGSRHINYDVWLYDQIVIQREHGASQSLIDYLVSSYSQSALDGLARSDFPFDDQYFAEQYEDGNLAQAYSDASFDLADRWGRRSDTYQLYVLILSIGLSFVGWASLVDKARLTKWLFSLMGAAILLVSILAVTTTALLSEPLLHEVDVTMIE